MTTDTVGCNCFKIFATPGGEYLHRLTADSTIPVDRELTASRAIAEAIGSEMRDDDEAFYMGEDVADYGGIFDSTQGFLKEFGHDRIMDVPISETASLGAAVGAAQQDRRPIAELMFVDFFGVAMDRIYNGMAKNTYMSGGGVSVPMILTVAVGDRVSDREAAARADVGVGVRSLHELSEPSPGTTTGIFSVGHVVAPVMSNRNPFDELDDLFDRMQENMEKAARAWEPGSELPGESSMSIDLEDRDDELVLTADLPGFETDDIDVRVKERTLQVSAERDEETEGTEGEYLRRERRHTSVSRSVTLPTAVDAEGVTATYNNGVLTVGLPKTAPSSEGTRIDVN